MKTVMTKITISLTDNDLWLLLDKHIENKHIALLMYDILCKNHQATEWFFRMHLGASYPEVPKEGARGYINLEAYTGWSGNKTLYLESEFNQHGFIPVTVTSFGGIDMYHPLTVKAPKLFDKALGEVEGTFTITIEEFIPEDDHDPYQAKLEGAV
jgi:hypothetical protein